MLSSPVEWGIVAAAALLLFGPKKFPEIGRALGQGIGNFKRALTDAQDQVVAGIEEGEKKEKNRKSLADMPPDASAQANPVQIEEVKADKATTS
ncbi:MAG: twin-arginine translocase TatA/TatE family subunit [Candidatus Melainabacteria bacterium]|nr:twin-arginine translocase TatA/TatE family subunit [Candidatus Melainabacteria bacterium]